MTHLTMRPMTFKPIEFTEYISPDGLKFRFDNHYRFKISEEGFGMPGIEYLSQKAPLQHGETYYDFRLQPRTIQIVVRENACDRQGYWDARANLLNYVRPNRQTIDNFTLGVLRKILPNGSKRDIDVIVQEGPMFSSGDRSRWDERGFTEAIRFIAPDPTFYDPDTLSISDDDSDFAHLVLPFTFNGDIILGTGDEAVVTCIINYTGTWISYPQIVIEGPITNPVITNTEAGKSMSLPAYSIAAGEVVTFDCAFGNKTINSSVNGNIISEVSSLSDFAEFAIFPAPQVANGVNTIVLDGDDPDPTGAVMTVYYKTRYIAI